MKENHMAYHQPSLLTTMTLDDALAIEPELPPTLGGILHSHGHETFEAPVVAQISQGDLPALFPDRIRHNSPVVIIGLPDWMENDLEALAASSLDIINQISDDLMMSETCLIATGLEHELHLETGKMMHTFQHIGMGGLHLLFICGSHLWIVQHQFDSDWHNAIAAAMMGAGFNYCPYSVFSSAQIAAAACGRGTGDQVGPKKKVWRPEVYYKAVASSNT
jgi:hypothetical protein